MHRFGVLNRGDSLKVCFLETVLRDWREGLVADLLIDEVELTQRRYAELRAQQNFDLLTSEATMPSGLVCRPTSFEHSAIWHAGGRWRAPVSA
ncbi:hypothetical protein [Mesorhizobium sp. LjNodule214]|uniref:hypothetical protein n=1 Tax=Mesorhizobium sp. LjNodule214 TaxID=3342252 RepID=UPI003ECE5240